MSFPKFSRSWDRGPSRCTSPCLRRSPPRRPRSPRRRPGNAALGNPSPRPPADPACCPARPASSRASPSYVPRFRTPWPPSPPGRREHTPRPATRDRLARWPRRTRCRGIEVSGWPSENGRAGGRRSCSCTAWPPRPTSGIWWHHAWRRGSASSRTTSGGTVCRASRRAATAATCWSPGGSCRCATGWTGGRPRTTLAPPQLKGMSLEQFRAGMRTFTRGAVALTPEVEAVFLSLMRVDRDGNIHPRLSRANHLRILRALWEQDAQGLLRRVRVPTLVLAVRSAPDEADSAGFMEEKERAADVVTAIDEAVRFEWIEGIHDIPIQRPDSVAERIERFAREVVG